MTFVIRTRVARPHHAAAIVAAARAGGFAAAADNDGYVAIGGDDAIVDRLLVLDASPRPHEAQLGALLGYPACCVSRVTGEGECRIDALADEATRWTYAGPFWAIDPTGYRVGRALISHIPCGPSCVASMRDACRALDHLRTSPPVPAWEPIRRWAQVSATR
ncbi:MAG: hypothetical protein ACR2NB_15230 [Solirubrobacteraceae bacterium]